MHRVNHCDDILNRRAGLHVVDRIEDEASARCEDLAAAQHRFSHFRRGSEWQRLLRVDTAAPKDQPRTVFTLQLRGVHPGGRTLDWIRDVEPGFNETLKESRHASAGVLERLPRGVAVNPIVDPLVVWEPQFPKRGDGAKRRSLRAEVGTADKDGIDRVPDALMDARQILQCELTL